MCQFYLYKYYQNKMSSQLLNTCSQYFRFNNFHIFVYPVQIVME